MNKKIKNFKVINFSNQQNEIERKIEAVLFAAEEPLDTESIKVMIKKQTTNINKTLESLQKQYQNRGVNLVCISGKWSFRTSENLSSLMIQQKTIQKKLSKAAIETLAIIVYHQPVTRTEIEEIRGVSFATGTLDILLELNWVAPAGRKNVPGKPIQYKTTEDFLSHFNLQNLSDLPNLDELASAGLIDSTKIDTSIFGTGNFLEQNKEEKKEDMYSEIDDMLSRSLENKND